MKKLLLFLTSLSLSLYGTIDFLGYKVASPIGVAACPLTHASGIKQLAHNGCDIFVYKTIRSTPKQSHPAPNYGFIKRTKPLTERHINGIIEVTNLNEAHSSVANSYGIASEPLDVIKKDIEDARNALRDDQLLIVSVYGKASQQKTIDQDFAELAQFAEEAGAHVIELNFSCPNVSEKPFYEDIHTIKRICRSVKRKTTVPFIIKIGYIHNDTVLEKIITTAALQGAQGISCINSVTMHAMNKHTCLPFFGNTRKQAGISGEVIHNLALDQIRRTKKIIEHHNLNVSIVGSGGITKQKDFDTMLQAGADIVLSATGLLLNKNLAHEYQKKHRKKSLTINSEKEQLILEFLTSGLISFGEYKLKSGIISPIYFDLRSTISHPDLFEKVTNSLAHIMRSCTYNRVCGIPYGALSFAATSALKTHSPMILTRKEIKKYGTKKQIEGIFKKGEKCIIIEDIITTGSSCLETIETLTKEGIIVTDIIALMNYKEEIPFLRSKGYNVHTLFSFKDVITTIERNNIVNNDTLQRLKSFYKTINL